MEIFRKTSKTKNTKDDELRTKDLEKLKGNIITKEIALELVRNNVSKIRIYKPELSVELIGKMLAQDIKDQNEQNIIIPANTILDENDIKRIIEQQYEKIEIWSDIKEINIRENLVSIIKDDVIGKNLGKELRDETGNIIALRT